MEIVSSEYLLRALSSLVVITILIGISVWWVRTKGSALGLSNGVQIRVVSRVSLDTKHKLFVVEIGDGRYLVATSPAGASVTALNGSDNGPKPSSEFGEVFRNELES